MLTADTITDDDIRRLLSLDQRPSTAHTVNLAMGWVGGARGAKRAARQRCADILNARVWDDARDVAVRATGHPRFCDCFECAGIREEAIRAAFAGEVRR